MSWQQQAGRWVQLARHWEFVANLRRSSLGQQMLAVRSNERAAAAAGVNVRNVKLAAFGISSFIAGISGALYGYNFSSVTVAPSEPAQMSICTSSVTAWKWSSSLFCCPIAVLSFATNCKLIVPGRASWGMKTLKGCAPPLLRFFGFDVP